MFVRKLRALGAPASLSLDLADDDSFQELIVWIEEKKLRHLEKQPEAREKLKKYRDASWPSLLEEYLVDVACPIPASDRSAVLDWLLRKCVVKAHADMDCTFRMSHDFKRVQVLRDGTTKGTVIDNDQPPLQPFASVDDKSGDFQTGVEVLAGILCIPLHYDPKITLQAVALVLQKFSDENIIISASGAEKEEKPRIPLSEVPLGMTVEDCELEPALRIVRLLHIANLRDLQTRFDEALVSLQQLTANPQTDSALGKIGRG